MTGYQPALGLTDFPTSSAFCLHVGFLTGSDWNYMSGSRRVDTTYAETAFSFWRDGHAELAQLR